MNAEQVAAIQYLRRKKRVQIKKKYWVHPLLERREQKGLFAIFYQELRQHREKFFNYTRMSIKSFDELLSKVQDLLKGENTRMRKAICPEMKLIVTLRYLATGCYFVDFHYGYRLGYTTVRTIVEQVCEVIWDLLKDVCLPEPTKEKWLEIAEGFKNRAYFPNCIGAVDGKHIRVIKPKHSGSMNYNYKQFYSFVLLAVCDSDYCFVAINVGADGKESDSRVFKDSLFYKSLQNNDMDLPDNSPISSTTNVLMPYVLVGDEAFQLTEHVMRPYGGKNLNTSKKIFNYRLSRARRYIECTFGLLANKWRIFHRPLNVKRSFAIKIIKACCILHNFVRKRDGCKFEDTIEIPQGLHNVPVGDVGKGNRPATRTRELLAEYFLNEGKIDWQDKYINTNII